MTREEKILLAIEKGYTCDYITGRVYGPYGKELLSKNTHGYMVIVIQKDKKQYQIKSHQFVYYCFHKKVVEQIDHINGIRHDNRIENLRSVTNQQNCFNQKAKGYSWHKHIKKWKTQLSKDGKAIQLGYFDTEEEARQAYLNAKKVYHIL